MPARPADPSRVADAQQRRARGEAPAEIARAMGVSERTIFRWLRTPIVPEPSKALEHQRAELRDALAEQEAALRARREKLQG